jgi:chromosomal replication initiation ATPase DnaA
MSKLDSSMSNKENNRNEFKIPMLAGPSGIGKTSVLQAMYNYTVQAPIQIKCHVTYYNGYAPGVNEKTRFNATT